MAHIFIGFGTNLGDRAKQLQDACNRVARSVKIKRTSAVYETEPWGVTGQPNDGMVTIVSASWGTFDSQTWPADHAEEVGYNLDNLVVPAAFPYLAKYDQIIASVADLP